MENSEFEKIIKELVKDSTISFIEKLKMEVDFLFEKERFDKNEK